MPKLSGNDLISNTDFAAKTYLPWTTSFTPPGSGRYVEGWYREGTAPLYVSRGVGTVIVEARLFCVPEIPIFTLRATTAGPRPDSPRTAPRPSA